MNTTAQKYFPDLALLIVTDTSGHQCSGFRCTEYIPTPARYKKEAPFLKEVDSQALCAIHQNLRSCSS